MLLNSVSELRDFHLARRLLSTLLALLGDLVSCWEFRVHPYSNLRHLLDFIVGINVVLDYLLLSERFFTCRSLEHCYDFVFSAGSSSFTNMILFCPDSAVPFISVILLLLANLTSCFWTASLLQYEKVFSCVTNPVTIRARNWYVDLSATLRSSMTFHTEPFTRRLLFNPTCGA